MKKKNGKHLQTSGLADLQTTKTLTRHFVTPSPKGRGERAAFTLAEVLITLGIIGVVAAITIPTLMVDINSKQWSTAKEVFVKKLNEAMKNMNTDQVISGHPDTLSFVNELGNHFKINKICKNDKLQDCFSETVWWGAGEATPEEVDMTTIKNASHFGLDYGTELIGVQFANGVTGLVAYNPKCSGDPLSNQFNGTNCISMLYDVSGARNPNLSSKDIGNYGPINRLGSSDCFVKINGVCLAMQPQVPTAAKKEECEAMKSTHGIQYCEFEDDYWAGAVKLCGHVNKMATAVDLGKIAAYVYNKESIGAEEYIDLGLSFNSSKLAELGLQTNSVQISLWAGEEDSAYEAYGRDLNFDSTSWGTLYRGSSNQFAVCIGD